MPETQENFVTLRKTDLVADDQSATPANPDRPLAIAGIAALFISVASFPAILAYTGGELSLPQMIQLSIILGLTGGAVGLLVAGLVTSVNRGIESWRASAANRPERETVPSAALAFE